MRASKKSIDIWRKKIDLIDKKLVKLLNQSAASAEEVGRLKQRLGLAVYSPVREEEILANVMKWNKGPMPVNVLHRLYERILDESRALERKVTQDTGPNSSPRTIKRRKDR